MDGYLLPELPDGRRHARSIDAGKDAGQLLDEAIARILSHRGERNDDAVSVHTDEDVNQAGVTSNAPLHLLAFRGCDRRGPGLARTTRPCSGSS